MEPVNENLLFFSKVRAVKSPTRAHDNDAGIDFYVPNDFNEGKAFSLRPEQAILIPSGIKVRGVPGHALILFNKSGVATKKGLVIGANVVDEGYEGEIHIHLINTTDSSVTIMAGDKITQGILLRVNYAIPTELPIEELFVIKSERGDGAFGSTDSK